MAPGVIPELGISPKATVGMAQTPLFHPSKKRRVDHSISPPKRVDHSIFSSQSPNIENDSNKFHVLRTYGIHHAESTLQIFDSGLGLEDLLDLLYGLNEVCV